MRPDGTYQTASILPAGGTSWFRSISLGFRGPSNARKAGLVGRPSAVTVLTGMTATMATITRADRTTTYLPPDGRHGSLAYALSAADSGIGSSAVTMSRGRAGVRGFKTLFMLRLGIRG